MKRPLILFLIVFIASCELYAQQGSVSGRIKSATDGKFLRGVLVKVAGVNTNSTSDSEGNFHIEGLKAGKYLLNLELSEFAHLSLAVMVEEGRNTDIGVLKMEPNHVKQLLESVDVVELSQEEMDEGDDVQGFFGMLTANKDPFTSATAYTFSSARFRRRGYGSEETGLFFNGVPMNNMENGRAYWYLWGGLNDVTRNQVNVEGLNLIDYGFGGFGGNINIDTRADNYSPGTKLTYSFSNKSYKHRTMVKYATGLMDNNLAITVSASKRWADEGFIEGTSYDAYAYFISALKRINPRHSIGITVFGAPSERGTASASVQQAYDLVGSNFYNPNWGWQDGEKRNARVQRTNIPIAILKYYWDFNRKTHIESDFTYISGESGKTALNWIDAPDPRPDYYRNLPIYSSNLNNEEVADHFKKNPQLDWEAMYRANYYNNPTGEARYFIEDRRRDIDQYIAGINIKHIFSEDIVVNGGLNYNNYTAHNFTQVEDLLGSQYVLDIDKFASRTSFNFDDPDLDPVLREELIHDLIQSDLNNPDRKVVEGDKFGYNYDSHINRFSGFVQADISYDKFDYYTSFSVSHTTMWRESFMRKGLFPENSYGESQKLTYLNYGVKGGMIYKLDGKNFFSLNAGYLTKAPFYRNVFLSPRTRHTSLEDINQNNSEKIISSDFGYNYQASDLKVKFNAYYTRFMNQTRSMGFYYDEKRTFVNSIQTGIDKTHMGLEFGFDAKMTTTLNLVGAAAFGVHKIDSRPLLTLVQDNNDEVLMNETVFVKNFEETGYPQQAYTAGIKYSGSNRVWAGLNANYFREMYLAYSPLRRTVGALDYKSVSMELYREVINQKQLDNQFTLDFNLGKSWNIDYKYYINVNLSVSNVLDNTDFITGGYEQSRLKNDLAETDISQFPPKLYYAYGRNFFLNISLRF